MRNTILTLITAAALGVAASTGAMAFGHGGGGAGGGAHGGFSGGGAHGGFGGGAHFGGAQIGGGLGGRAFATGHRGFDDFRGGVIHARPGFADHRFDRDFDDRGVVHARPGFAGRRFDRDRGFGGLYGFGVPPYCGPFYSDWDGCYYGW